MKNTSRVTRATARRGFLGLCVAALVASLAPSAAASQVASVNTAAKKPRTISISGSTYADVNQNGLYDRGDRPLPNVRVTLRIQVEDPKLQKYRWVLAGNTRTNAQGQYSFSNVPAFAWRTHVSAEVGGGYGTTQSGGTRLWQPEKKRYVDRPLFSSDPKVDRSTDRWRTAHPRRDYNGAIRRVNFGKLVAPLPAHYAKLTDSEATILFDLNEFRRVNNAPPLKPGGCTFTKSGEFDWGCRAPDGGQFTWGTGIGFSFWAGGFLAPSAGLILSDSKPESTKVLLDPAAKYAAVHFDVANGVVRILPSF